MSPTPLEITDTNLKSILDDIEEREKKFVSWLVKGL